MMIVLLWPAIRGEAAARAIKGGELRAASAHSRQPAAAQTSGNSSLSGISAYEGKVVEAIEIPQAPQRDREHLLQMLPLKAGDKLGRDQVRESIRVLYATGRFADIQAEVTPAGDGVVLTFVTSLNFFVGAIDVEGAPSHPNANQIINASKFELGELYTQEKLDRALQNIRLLMQENGYYRARVTAESTSNVATQQANVLFHITPGPPAHVGEVQVTGTSGLPPFEIQRIAHMDHGDRVTASRISDSLQRLRKNNIAPRPTALTTRSRSIPDPWW
jgi:outer membrane protein insertion porin family